MTYRLLARDRRLVALPPVDVIRPPSWGTAVGSWETFRLFGNTNGTVSLLATVNNHYVYAGKRARSHLIANRIAIGQWEQFDLAIA